MVGGANYGQGSSREHAALGPAFLGLRAVLRQELRPHPRTEPGQLRGPAADLCRPRRLRRPSRPATCCASSTFGGRSPREPSF